MLTLTTRIWIALAALVLTVAGAVVLEVADTGAELRAWLLGCASTVFVLLLDMLRARKIASERPPEPQRSLGREETNPRLPLALPREATGPHPVGVPMMLTEDDIDTERPPAPVLPLDDGDDADTDPQTPSAKRWRQS